MAAAKRDWHAAEPHEDGELSEVSVIRGMRQDWRGRSSEAVLASVHPYHERIDGVLVKACWRWRCGEEQGEAPDQETARRLAEQRLVERGGS